MYGASHRNRDLTVADVCRRCVMRLGRGLCGSTTEKGADPKEAEKEKQANKDIQQRMDKDKERYDDVLKLLLLGTGDSGKSTLFKQIIQIYGKGYALFPRHTTSVV